MNSLTFFHTFVYSCIIGEQNANEVGTENYQVGEDAQKIGRYSLVGFSDGWFWN